MESSVEKLSARKEAALRALLDHKTLEQAAKSCNVNVRTLRRWMRTRKFLARYRREQDALLSSTVDLLRAESASAVATLAAIAKDANTPLELACACRHAKRSSISGLKESRFTPSQKESRNLSDTKTRNSMSDEVKAPSSSIPAAEAIPETVTVAEIAKNSEKYWYQQQLVKPGESVEEG